MIALPSRSEALRLRQPAKYQDEPVSPGDLVGTTNMQGAIIWTYDGHSLRWLGAEKPSGQALVQLRDGQGVREALEGNTRLFGTDFVIHKMQLKPEQYYPRIARPNNSHPDQSPGFNPAVWDLSVETVGALNQVRMLIGMLEAIFQTLHPDEKHHDCFGAAIKNVLLLASMECESHWRAILKANGYPAPDNGRLSTNDYVKLMPAMRLDEYSVTFLRYPWLDDRCPFAGWSPANPTKSMPWYDDYNAAKHDREASYHRATLASALDAIAALWIMIAAQFGKHALAEFPELSSYFGFPTLPRWRFSEVYIHGDHPGVHAVSYPF